MGNSTSSTSAQIFPFSFGEHGVRVIMRGDEPWFVAADICGALGYKNTTQAIADNLDADERYICQIERGGSLVIISESGLYALILRSRKPEARRFAKWVTAEVLPALRKTGAYSSTTRQAPSALPPLQDDTYRQQAQAMAMGYIAQLRQMPAWEQVAPKWDETEAQRMADGIVAGWMLHPQRWLMHFDGHGAARLKPLSPHALLVDPTDLDALIDFVARSLPRSALPVLLQAAITRLLDMAGPPTLTDDTAP